jgi:hypothetical protein
LALVPCIQISAVADEEHDKTEDEEDLKDASDDERSRGGESDDDDDAEDEPTKGEDSQHCPRCGWCDAEEMVVCEVDACSQWHHVDCLGLTKAEADQLSDPDFLWLCPACDPSQVEE